MTNTYLNMFLYVSNAFFHRARTQSFQGASCMYSYGFAIVSQNIDFTEYRRPQCSGLSKLLKCLTLCSFFCLLLRFLFFLVRLGSFCYFLVKYWLKLVNAYLGIIIDILFGLCIPWNSY